MFLNYFDILILKIIFFKKKKIINIFFWVKKILKNIHNHTPKQQEKKHLYLYLIWLFWDLSSMCCI
jgi:hypothetical protein